MLERITNILKQSNADGYQVVHTLTKAHEFYFIKDKLDMNRSKEVVHNLVTVYKSSEDKKYLGSATIEVFDSSDDSEMIEMINKAIYSASFVKNPYYELAKPESVTVDKSTSIDILEVAKDFITVMQEVEQTETEDINSYEIFVNENNKRIVNSNGIDVEFDYINSMLEVVVNARKDDEEIELYRCYLSGSCDKESIKSEIESTMKMGKDKCIAVDTPAIKESTVVFSTSSALSFFKYYASRTNVASIYQQVSTYKVGESINAEVIKGDKVSMKGVDRLDNSSSNFVFDDDGKKVKSRTLIENNICKGLWGSQQYSYYLEMEDICNYYNFVVEGGSKSASELRSGKYLEVVEFSDFQVDSMTQEFAGEIRLAYYHDGDKITPCVGGSISGNMKVAETCMWFSKEVKQYNNYIIPVVIAVEKVTVTGIE